MLRERLESMEGRTDDDCVAAPMPAAFTGMGALIWRGALMVGASFFLVRFLRREMPFCFSDMAGGSLTGELYADDVCR